MDIPTDQAPAPPGWRRQPVNSRPGFLIRRLNQIHTALFNNACGSAGITPIMYSVLSALAQTGPADQSSLARNIAVNKTNMVNLMERMRKRGLIRRSLSPDDRRVRLVVLTDAGRSLLDQIDGLAWQAHIRTLEDLSPADRDTLMALMAQIVDAKGAILDT
jgi:DNA-binding MarR family transcriptional regulator